VLHLSHFLEDPAHAIRVEDLHLPTLHGIGAREIHALRSGVGAEQRVDRKAPVDFHGEVLRAARRKARDLDAPDRCRHVNTMSPSPRITHGAETDSCGAFARRAAPSIIHV
jgi:hypothetical protein